MAASRARSALFAVAALVAAVGPAPAFAGERVVLRPDPTSGAQVTLGDLFDGAGAAGNVVIGYGAPNGESAVLDADKVQSLAAMHGLDWDNPGSVRRILVRSGPAHAEAPSVETLVYARSLAAGEMVQPQDVAYAKTPRFAVPADAPRDADGVIGMIARHPVRSGAPVAAHDLTAAQVIKREDAVEVQYSSGGVTLTMQGKAMAAAAIGEPVAVMNPASKKVIQAVASGPDQAVVGPAAEAIRSAALYGPSQFASIR
jgi:flagella basal body P-ring formation protein FlgA